MSAKKKDENYEEVQIDDLQSTFEKYQKPLSYVAIAIILLVGGYIGYKELVLKPKQEEASLMMFKAEKYFGQDSFMLALNGGNDFDGFVTIAEDYGMTDAGNLANYYAGICNLHLADKADSAEKNNYFEAAIDHLKKFSSDSKNIGPLGKGALGDAYSELGEYDKAAAAYQEAANFKNEFTGPQFLMKLGLVYEELGQGEKAASAYKSIKNDYPTSQAASNIDKYIARAESQK